MDIFSFFEMDSEPRKNLTRGRKKKSFSAASSQQQQQRTKEEQQRREMRWKKDDAFSNFKRVLFFSRKRLCCIHARTVVLYIYIYIYYFDDDKNRSFSILFVARSNCLSMCFNALS